MTNLLIGFSFYQCYSDNLKVVIQHKFLSPEPQSHHNASYQAFAEKEENNWNAEKLKLKPSSEEMIKPVLQMPIQVDTSAQQLKEYSQEQALMIDSALKKYLLKKKITIVDSQGDLIITIKTYSMGFSSLGGWFFDETGYDASRDGKVLFSGSFKQAKNAGISRYLSSPKGPEYIGTYLAKDILSKLSTVKQ